MAKKKKEEEEEKKKKTKQKRTKQKVSDVYTGHSRDRDRNAIRQSNEAQFNRNKENFLQRRTMFKKSRLAENFDAGRLNMKDLKEINEHFADSDRNKATLLKRIIKKAKRTRPKK
jgi:polyhydroxyalkanoate synthesis regulator protein